MLISIVRKQPCRQCLGLINTNATKRLQIASLYTLLRNNSFVFTAIIFEIEWQLCSVTIRLVCRHALFDVIIVADVYAA